MSKKLQTDNIWPPPHTVRRSRKAKNVLLNLTPVKGLEIVVPYRVSLAYARAFLEERREWVETHYQASLLEMVTRPEKFPRKLSLAAIEKSWHVKYETVPLSKTRLQLIETPHELCFFGRVDDFRACLPYLKSFLRKVAEKYLTPMLDEICMQTQLKYTDLSWRFQKTLWGSCTDKTDLSLNAKMLFLQPELAQHIMLHELCHTKYMNHSHRFWQLVASYSQNYEAFETELKEINQLLPSWCALI